nr:MAG TPA: hypothetical protein [Bacteriophage sp.]
MLFSFFDSPLIYLTIKLYTILCIKSIDIINFF